MAAGLRAGEAAGDAVGAGRSRWGRGVGTPRSLHHEEPVADAGAISVGSADIDLRLAVNRRSFLEQDREDILLALEHRLMAPLNAVMLPLPLPAGTSPSSFLALSLSP